MRKTGFAAGLSALLAGSVIAFAGVAYAADDNDSGGSSGSGDSSIDGNAGSSGGSESGGMGRYGAFDITRGAGAQGKDGGASTKCKQQFKINMYAPMQCQAEAANAAGASEKHKHGGRKKTDHGQEPTNTRGSVGSGGQSNQSQNGQIALPGLSR